MYLGAVLVLETISQERSFLVGLGGLEPPTSSLSVKRSNHLSYRPVEPFRHYTKKSQIAKLVCLQKLIALNVFDGFFENKIFRS